MISTVPLAAEELTASAQPVRLGKVHVRTSVETEEQRFTVPLASETAYVERIPASEFDASAPYDPDTIIIPITEERLVVRTERVITEYVRITRRRTVEDHEVTGTVRREIVTLTPEAAGDHDPTTLVQLEDTPATS